MIFTEDGVDLPDPLLQSLTSDQLIVFVGAGVSARAYPKQPEGTWYPTFADLAREIAKRTNRTLTPQEERSLGEGLVDRVLGEWDERSGVVNRHAAEVLVKNETGQRIQLHQNILRLFTPDLTPRIVTTNFDNLLLRARDAERLTAPKWRTHVAPALPPANRFSGICFLHGRVDDPSEMVLTDADIGRAYMEEGWALQFAHAMFQRFDVLFIGYSLEDPPLRYLSLALEGTAPRKRWALVPRRGNSVDVLRIERDWIRRNVEPVWYPARRRDYRALERTLGAWTSDNARPFIDRRSLLIQVAGEKPTSLRPHDLGRAEYFLRDSAALRDFARSELDFEWFDHLLQWRHFDYLLKSTGRPADATSPLAERLVDWLFQNPIDVIGKLSAFRETINLLVLEHVCRRVTDSRLDATSTQALLQIIEFFRPALERRRADSFVFIPLEELLVRLIDEGHVEHSIWLYRSILRTESSVRRQPNFSRELARLYGQDVGDTPEFELRFELAFADRSADYQARQLFQNVLVPRMSLVGPRLVATLADMLLEASAFDRLGRSGKSHHFRSAIEIHPQDQYRHGPVHVLLDLLRDSWEALLVVSPTLARVAYAPWQHANNGLLERLRIHAIRRSWKVSASSTQEALTTLFEPSHALWRYEMRHESLLLLRSLYEQPELRDFLCTKIIAGPPAGFLGTNAEKCIFETLSFLARAGFELPTFAIERLHQIELGHLDLEDGSHEGMTRWTQAGFVPHPRRVNSVVSIKPEDVASEVRMCQAEGEEVLREMAESIGLRIAKEREWGLRTLTEIAADIENVPENFWNPVLWGIRAFVADESNAFDAESAEGLLAELTRLVRKLPIGRSWSSLPSLLKDLVERGGLAPASWHPLGQLLQTLFEHFDFDRQERHGPVEWLNDGINHPYGDLAQLYLKTAQSHVSHLVTSKEPLVLEPHSQIFFARLADVYGKGSRYGYALISERIAWMEAVDPQYAVRMQRWFDWASDEERALVSWSGYLWSRTLSNLLAKDFDVTYGVAVQRHSAFASDERHGLAEHLAALFWFRKVPSAKLGEVAAHLDSELRLNILHAWKSRLGQASAGTAVTFMAEVVFPYWEMCSRYQFFHGDGANMEKLAFWGLLPYSYELFPQALRHALDNRPASSESLHPSIRHVISDAMLEYADEFVELLLVWLEIQPHTTWEQSEWRELWPKLKLANPRRLSDLENELARRDIPV